MNKQPPTGTKSTSATATMAAVIFFCIAVSCNINGTVPSSTGQFTAVKGSVGMLMDSIASSVSKNGPTAWLHYFEQSSGFFMADNGNLVFANNDCATNFVNNTVAKVMKSVQLTWRNVRIDPLTANLANIGADYHEDIIFFSKNQPPTMVILRPRPSGRGKNGNYATCIGLLRQSNKGF